MKNILVAIDGSRFADSAMDKAKEFADIFGSTVTILFVDDSRQRILNKTSEFDEQYAEMFDMASRDILESGKQRLAGLGDRLIIKKLEGNVANAIVDYANENDFDLIILGSRGKGKVQRFLLGSVTIKVASHVNKSVLIVK